jgi:hypothetical protein
MVNKIQFLNINVIPVPLCYCTPSTFTSSLFVFLSLHLFLSLLLSLFCERLLLWMRYLANIDYISFTSLLLFLGCSRVLEYMVNKIQFLNLNVIPVPLCYRAPSTFTSCLFVFQSLHIFLTLLLSLFCKQLLLRMQYLAKIDCISFTCFDISKLFICMPLTNMANKIQFLILM